MTHDTDPPPPPEPTSPELPEDPIPAGRAARAVNAAMFDVLAAVARAQAVCAAIARQLDASAQKGTP